VLVRVLRAHVLGVRLAKQDRKRSERALREHLQLDPKYIGPSYDDVIEYIYEDGHLPSDQALDLFFDMGIQVGRYTERWPREKYWTPRYVDSYNEWKPTSSSTP